MKISNVNSTKIREITKINKAVLVRAILGVLTAAGLSGCLQQEPKSFDTMMSPHSVVETAVENGIDVAEESIEEIIKSRTITSKQELEIVEMDEGYIVTPLEKTNNGLSIPGESVMTVGENLQKLIESQTEISGLTIRAKKDITQSLLANITTKDNITNLDITFTDVDEIEGDVIQDYKNLESLTLSNETKNLDFLNQHLSLKKLELLHVTDDLDMMPIKRLQNLKVLTLIGGNYTNLNFIEGSSSLTDLTINMNLSLTDRSAITTCPNLKNVFLIDYPETPLQHTM